MAKADPDFPICVGTCGLRGTQVLWFQVGVRARFGECARCHIERVQEIEREDPRPTEWEPPSEDSEE